MSSIQPWNDWYHCMGNTYGTWLPGDERGFRTRHHRQHVEGDYRHPPPKGTYEKLHAHARSLMSREPVHLTPSQRRFVCGHIAGSLLRREVEVVIVAVNAHHLHLLARFRNHNPRHHLGVAKKESSYYLGAEQGGPAGGIWAARSKCLPIRDRQHQLNVVDYVLSHRKLGAIVWFQGHVLDP